jgi:hypothetical protein
MMNEESESKKVAREGTLERFKAARSLVDQIIRELEDENPKPDRVRKVLAPLTDQLEKEIEAACVNFPWFE